MALTDKLSAIGAAIREKTGSTELMTLDAMPAAIAAIETGGGGIPNPIVFPGQTLQYWGAYNAQNWLAELGQPITIECNNVNNACSYMFYNSAVEDLSNLTFISNNKNAFPQMDKCFNNCSSLKKLPKFYGYSTEAADTGGSCQNYFEGCNQLREIPDDFFRKHDADGNLLDGWIIREHSTVYYCYYRMFSDCYSLRNFPQLPPTFSSSYGYHYMFYCCYALDEIINLPVNQASTSNATPMSGAFVNCCRLKRLTWAQQEDGTPYAHGGKNATLDLSQRVGYASTAFDITGYNSGITEDKQVTDAASYAALKDDPDWWTTDVNYSRYNHDSAVETINSLPDCTASGGTNTIKFLGASGALTDGGAINTLTEDEIAVATAKGWTVELV